MGMKLLNQLPWHYCFWQLKTASLTSTKIKARQRASQLRRDERETDLSNFCEATGNRISPPRAHGLFCNSTLQRESHSQQYYIFSLESLYEAKSYFNINLSIAFFGCFYNISHISNNPLLCLVTCSSIYRHDPFQERRNSRATRAQLSLPGQSHLQKG